MTGTRSGQLARADDDDRDDGYIAPILSFLVRDASVEDARRTPSIDRKSSKWGWGGSPHDKLIAVAETLRGIRLPNGPFRNSVE